MIAGDPIGRDRVSLGFAASRGSLSHARRHDPAQVDINRADHAVLVMEAGETECRHHVRPLTIADSRWEDAD